MKSRATSVQARFIVAAALFLSVMNLRSESPAKKDTAPVRRDWPGRSIRTATGLEGIYTAMPENGNLVNGFGMRGTLAVEGLPVRHLVLETSAGYRWIYRDGEPVPLPGGMIASGWRFPMPGALSLTPIAGGSLEMILDSATAKPAVSLSGGLRISVLLAGKEYLTLTPFVSLPLTSGLSPSASFAVGLRSENPWMLPIPEERPSVRASPALFSPDGDGVDDKTRILLKCADRSAIVRWSLTVFGANGKKFLERAGTGKPPRFIDWNGETTDSIEIEPASDYRIVFETEDALGRDGRGEASVTCDILVIKDGDRYKIRVSDINFPSDSWDFSDKESKKLLEANRKVLARISQLFSQFPDYSMTIEGYANAVNWSDPKKFAEEQKKELLPLSQKRADAVKAALVILGIDEGRIRAVGLGGTRPLADFADARSIWKNRRVEFILAK